MRHILFFLFLALLLASCSDPEPTAPGSGKRGSLLMSVWDGTSPTFLWPGSKIVRSDADGSNQHVITQGLLVAAPRAGKMLFHHTDELFKLRIASIDGSNEIIIDSRWNFLTGADISPDGRQFVVVENEPGDLLYLLLIHRDILSADPLRVGHRMENV